MRLVPVGWGWRYASLRVEGSLVARAVCGAASAVSGPLRGGTAVEVAAEEVVRPKQLAAEVGRLCYVAVRGFGCVEGGPGSYPAGSVVRVEVKMPEALPRLLVRLRWVGGWGSTRRGARRRSWRRGPYLRRRGLLCGAGCPSSRGAARLRTRLGGLTSASCPSRGWSWRPCGAPSHFAAGSPDGASTAPSCAASR